MAEPRETLGDAGDANEECMRIAALRSTAEYMVEDGRGRWAVEVLGLMHRTEGIATYITQAFTVLPSLLIIYPSALGNLGTRLFTPTIAGNDDRISIAYGRADMFGM